MFGDVHDDADRGHADSRSRKRQQNLDRGPIEADPALKGVEVPLSAVRKMGRFMVTLWRLAAADDTRQYQLQEHDDNMNPLTMNSR
jgi:penicillin V acylase-like amidase (Ntn superfamily)